MGADWAGGAMSKQQRPPFTRRMAPRARTYAWRFIQQNLPADMPIETRRSMRIFIMEAASDEFLVRFANKQSKEEGMRLIEDELTRQAQRIMDIYNARYGGESEGV
jgi:hypothetical protein